MKVRSLVTIVVLVALSGSSTFGQRGRLRGSRGSPKDQGTQGGQGSQEASQRIQQQLQLSPEQEEQLQNRTGKQPSAETVDPLYLSTPLNVVVPTGTPLMIRMIDGVSSDTASDRPFSGKLETEIKVGQTLVAPKGSLVYGKVVKSRKSRRLVGQAKIDLTLTGLTVKEVLYPIKTGDYKEKGDRAGAETDGAAAAGAVAGGLATDSDIESEQEEGAQKGAAVGVGLSGLHEEDDLTVAPGSLLQFDLTAPLTIDETK